MICKDCIHYDVCRDYYNEIPCDVDKFEFLTTECSHFADKSQYTAHEVAVILSDAFGDKCACNYNGNDEWLPEYCEFTEECPNPGGVACWEQYLKALKERENNA